MIPFLAIYTAWPDICIKKMRIDTHVQTLILTT